MTIVTIGATITTITTTTITTTMITTTRISSCRLWLLSPSWPGLVSPSQRADSQIFSVKTESGVWSGLTGLVTI